jgi:hypothetical protein
MSGGYPRKALYRLLRIMVAIVVLVGAGGAMIRGFIESRNQLAVETDRERPVRAPLRVSNVNGAAVIKLDAETQRRNGIETTTLMPAPYQEEVRAYGIVLDLAHLTDLNNRYANAKSQLQTAQAKLAASKTAFERAQSLYNHQQAVSLAQVQTAEAAFRVDEAAVTAAQSHVRTLAATAEQEWGAVLGKSLIDGSPMVNRLIERQDFLLQITLPPGVSLSKPPATAFLQTSKATRAAIAFVSFATRADPKIQGVSFFYVVPAESGVLPGMNVLAFLGTGTTAGGGTVPAGAIVWWQDRAWAYRRSGPDRFTRIEISTDLPAPGGGYIVKDLPNDAEIVTSGAQLLLSEEFRAQIQVGGD